MPPCNSFFVLVLAIFALLLAATNFFLGQFIIVVLAVAVGLWFIGWANDAESWLLTQQQSAQASPAAAPAEEITPLLAPSSADNATTSAVAGGESAPVAAIATAPLINVPGNWQRPIFDRVGTWVSLVSAVLTVGFFMALRILLDAMTPPGFSTSWTVQNTLFWTPVCGVAAIFLAALNITRLRLASRFLPLGVNFIVDSYIAFNLCIRVPSAFFSTVSRCLGSQPGYPGYPNPPNYDLETCRKFQLKMDVLIYLFLAFALVLCATHFTLFALRGIRIAKLIVLAQQRNAGRNGAGRGVGMAWGSNQFTVEFTVKMLGPDHMAWRNVAQNSTQNTTQHPPPAQV